MGKHLHGYSDVQLEGYQPSCLWGIFHALDYHQWYNVKRILPHRKYHRGRHVRCCANPRTISIEHDPGEAQGLLDAESVHFQNSQDAEHMKTSSANKSSGKACTKERIVKEKPEEGNKKDNILGISMGSQLQQTNPVHALEPSAYGISSMNPIILVHKRATNSDARLQRSSLTSKTEKLVSSSKSSDDQVSEKYAVSLGKLDQTNGTLIYQKSMPKVLKRQVSCDQVKELDVKEIFKVKKELFLDILQDPEVGISKHFPDRIGPTRKVKLTKSGSFPVAESSRIRYIRPSTLEHKQNEIWLFPKGEKLFSDVHVSNLKGLRTSDNAVQSTMTQETSFVSQEVNHQSWNQLVMNRLKDIKHRIKYALKEKRRRSNHTITNELSFKVPTEHASTDGKMMSGRLRKTSTGQDNTESSRSCHQTDAFDYDGSGGVRQIIRADSLNESIDRYAQLLEQSSSRKATFQGSRSLKLTNEDNVSSRGRTPRFFRRISSLSDLESFCSLLNEVSRDALSSEMPTLTALNCSTNSETDGHSEPNATGFPVDVDEEKPLEAVPETEFQEKAVKVNGQLSSTGLLVNGKGISESGNCSSEDRVESANSRLQEEENGFAINLSTELPQPSSDSVRDTCPPAEHPISEDMELNSWEHHMEGDSCFLLQNGCSKVPFPGFCSTENHEILDLEYKDKGISKLLEHFEVDKEGDACFNYVRDVVELSGLTENEYLGTWYSPDQPLNPSLFKELETCQIHELDEDSDHQLLFDVINEALVEIYDRSPVHFPSAFPFVRRNICPSPKGILVLQEVWGKVSRQLGFTPDMDQSLDDIVARDLSKDNWMNLQLEAEFVALDLEDLIFDELLDELFVVDCC